jgi:hypothetical protein
VTAGAGALATAGDGFTVLVVVADFMAAPGAAAAVVVALEATLFVVCGTAALTGGADVPAYIALPCCAAGAQGALAAADAAGAAAFFLKSDPKLAIAALAFETAVLAPAAV